MDFICKASAWLNGMIPNEREDIRQQLIRHGDRLLEKYDFEANKELGHS